MMLPDDPFPDAAFVHRMDQTASAFRDTAALLALFRDELIDQGFTQQGAEHLTDTFAIAVLAREQ
jgi:uncharacterized protein Yka (UPF0111/DUF47 family)